MENLTKPQFVFFLLISLALSLTSPTSIFAQNAGDICQRLPNVPAPQTTSTLRLLTAFTMPTITAQFGTSASETDFIHGEIATNGEERTLRTFTRDSRPYHWEVGLYWNLSKLFSEQPFTPLVEAYQHHEHQLHEAYKICRDLNSQLFTDRRVPSISNINSSNSLEQTLSELEEQRITALLQIYVPHAINTPAANNSTLTIATGELP